MDGPVTFEQVTQGLLAAYRHPDVKVQQQATKWLETFQRSAEAWQICDQLLMLQSADPFLIPMQLFAARTLRAKIQEELSEVPPSAHASLRASLEAHLRRVAQSRTAASASSSAPTAAAAAAASAPFQPLVTQLSLALAALALQLDPPDRLVPGVIEALASSGGEEATLEVLCALPEEADSARLPLEPTRRHALLAGLQRAAAGVVELLERLWTALCSGAQASSASPASVAAHQHSSPASAPSSSPPPAAAARVLRCVAAWVSLGGGLSVEDWCAPHRLLLPAAFGVLGAPPPGNGGPGADSSSEALFSAAVDVVLGTVRLCEPPSEHPAAVRQLVPRVLALRDAFAAAVRAADVDRAGGLTAVLVELCESCLPLVLQRQPDVTEPLLSALLERTAHRDEPDVAAMTFSFWYRLQEQLQTSSPPGPERTAYWAHFRGTFERLLLALIQLAEYPSDWDDLGSDERDDHEQLRHTLADMFRDATAIIGPPHALSQLYGLVRERLRDRWTRLEAALYAVRCLGRTVEGQLGSSDDEPLGVAVEQLLALVPQLPVEQHKVLYTGTLIVGRYADWLQRRPRFLQPMLSFLTQSLAITDVAPAAALAVKHVCNACRGPLAAGASSLEALFGVLAGASQHGLPLVAQVELLEGVAYVVSAVPDPAANLLPAVDRLAQPLLDALLRQLQAQQPLPIGPAALPIADSLAKLKTVLQFVVPPPNWSGPPPVQGLVTRLWPVLMAMFEPMRNDPLVVERLCTLCRYCIKPLGSQFEPYLPSLVSELVRGYGTKPHSCYLYTFNECVGTFGSGPHVASLLAALSEFVRHTMNALPTLEACESHPDLHEELMELCCRFMRRSPAAFVASPVIVTVFQQAVATVNMQHREASRAVLSFIEQLLSLDPQLVGPHRDALLASHGQSLMQALVYGAAAVIPYSRINHQAGVVRALFVCAPQQAASWLYNVLQNTFPPFVTSELRSQVGNALMRSNADIGSIRNTLHQFADSYTKAERKSRKRS